MPETEIKKTVRTTVRSTVSFTSEEVESILRQYVGAPANADVDLDCSYDSLGSATVSWEVVEETRS